MNVLSLFDGMSCGRIALERAGIKVDNYFASEIKKHAIICSKDNYPDIKHIGNVKNISFKYGNLIYGKKIKPIGKIDLLIGGSPCQDFTRIKTHEDRLGLKGEKSGLFYEYFRILKECLEINPDLKFLLENVKMKPEQQAEISEILGVKPININSNLVSFQNRDRFYWTNITGVKQPIDRKISFKDYIIKGESKYLDKFAVNKTPSRILMYEKQCPNVTYRDKINCLTCKQDRRDNSGLIDYKDFCRYLSTQELEQAQNVPLNYTKSVSLRQAEDLLGDGWTVDVIAHIFKNINN